MSTSLHPPYIVRAESDIPIIIIDSDISTVIMVRDLQGQRLIAFVAAAGPLAVRDRIGADRVGMVESAFFQHALLPVDQLEVPAPAAPVIRGRAFDDADLIEPHVVFARIAER